MTADNVIKRYNNLCVLVRIHSDVQITRVSCKTVVKRRAMVNSRVVSYLFEVIGRDSGRVDYYNTRTCTDADAVSTTAAAPPVSSQTSTPPQLRCRFILLLLFFSLLIQSADSGGASQRVLGVFSNSQVGNRNRNRTNPRHPDTGTFALASVL